MTDPILIAIPVFTFLVLLELYLTYKMQSDHYTKMDAFGSLSMGVGSIIVGLASKVLIYFVYSFVFQYRLFDFEMNIPILILLFFFDDFSYYWFHRISHSSRFLWASHSIHHSSLKYNLSTALRQTWTGDFSGSFLFWIWLPFIGFSPESVIAMKAISLIYQFWIHTEFIDKLPKWFEFVFNTPSHHRVHHAVQDQYLDRNHAGILIIWDKFFGTFVPEIEKPVYGLVKNINTYNPIRIAFYEWRQIALDMKMKTGFKNKLKYVFYPPGWSHDNSRMTSAKLRDRYYQNRKNK